MSEDTKESGIAERLCPHCQYKDFYPDPMPVGTRCSSCTKSLATLVQRTSVGMADRGVHLSTLDELYRFSDMIAKSKAYGTWKDASAIAVAVQTGLELGFTPITSLRSFYVAKDGSRPELYGQAALALIRGSHNVSWVEVGTSDDEWDNDKHYGYCQIQRKGISGKFSEVQFSVAEAKRAKLWMDPKGAWSKYSEDMLIWKAVARLAKRFCSDILLGVEIREAQDTYIRHLKVDEETGEIIEADTQHKPSNKPDPIFDAIDAEVVDEKSKGEEGGSSADQPEVAEPDEPDRDGVDVGTGS